MTPQLQAALDALNACPDADAVAALLRRHGIRASGPKRGPVLRCKTCPLVRYFVEVGGVSEGSEISGGLHLYFPGGLAVRLPEVANEFVRRADRGAYPDLEAA